MSIATGAPISAECLDDSVSSTALDALDDPNLLPHRHIPALDAVRGVAILLVMVFHFTLLTENLDNRLSLILSKTSLLGRCGVDLFFVLSGFLITGLLYDAKGSKYFFRTFYSRRVLRILPLYFAALVLFIWLLPLAGLQDRFQQNIVTNQIWLWLHAANIGILARGGDALGGLGHLWSLAVEEHFYLLWPAVLFIFSRKTLLRICVGVMIGSFAIRMAIMLGGDYLAAWGVRVGPQDVCYIFTPCRFEQFAIGGWVAIMARGPLGLRPLAQVAKWLAPVCFALLFVLLAVRDKFRTPGQDEVLMPTFGYSIVAYGFAACIVLAIAQPKLSRMGRIVNAPILRMFGKYSYALYIFHVAVFDVVWSRYPIPKDASIAKFGLMYLGLGAVCLVISLAAALVSWHVWEKHFMGLKRYFNYRTAPATQPVEAPASKVQPDVVAV